MITVIILILGKKRRLRKLAMPLMVLILLKAITIIPMAIGILKVKAVNALGLGFLSFLVSVGLAIFQLCKKVRKCSVTSFLFICRQSSVANMRRRRRRGDEEAVRRSGGAATRGGQKRKDFFIYLY